VVLLGQIISKGLFDINPYFFSNTKKYYFIKKDKFFDSIFKKDNT